MALKKFIKQLKTPVEELDSERLRAFASSVEGCCTIDALQPRQLASVVGEISSVRIVPRAGSPSLEATVTDGSGAITAVWTGRRRIAGIGPGRRLVLTGRTAASDSASGRLLLYNPVYELL